MPAAGRGACAFVRGLPCRRERGEASSALGGGSTPAGGLGHSCEPAIRPIVQLFAATLDGVSQAPSQALSNASIGLRCHDVHQGMANVDTLWFHMTHAARFFQDASTVHVLYTTPGSIAPFYPSNFELIQALGMLPFHHEFLGP